MEAIDIKRQAHNLIDRLPDDCDIDDIQYHLYVMKKVQNGLEAIEDGRVLHQEEAEKRLNKWIIE